MKKFLKHISVSILFIALIALFLQLIWMKYNPVARAEEIAAEMSTQEKIGQVLLMDFRQWHTADSESKEDEDVDKINDEIKSIIGDYHLGNIILFTENCRDTEKLTALTYDLQQAALVSGNLPLLIAVDQEGGNVARLVQGCSLSGSMAIGASGKVENAALSADIIASELNAVGINCDFAPDADVNTNPNNPVIGMRSYSADPKTAAVMASAFAEEMENQKIISCAKHFPGHGDTDTDSHTGLPMVSKTKEEWLGCDAVPFIELIDNDIPMIMTAHIQYPQLDPTQLVSSSSGEKIYVPATLSHRILTDILRGELGYKGVIVTDAMNMGAIADNFGETDAVIRALNAGADLICMPVTLRCLEDLEKLDALYSAIAKALVDGTLPEARLNEAAVRVLAMKIKAGIFKKEYDYDIEEAAANADLTVGGTENRLLERQLALDCVGVEYSGEFRAFAPSSADRIMVFMPYENEITSAKYAISRLQKDGFFGTLNVEYYCYNGLTEFSEKTIDLIASADYVIIGSEQTATSIKNEEHWLNTMPQKILSYVTDARTAIICEGLPYQAERYSKDHPCIMLYNYSGMNEADIDSVKFNYSYGPAIPAGFEAIFGFTLSTGSGENNE